MDAASRQSAARLAGNVAEFGNRLSQVLHTFDAVERYTHYNLPDLVGNLDATIQGLNQVCKLLCSDELQISLFSDEGVKYVERLAEECSVAMERVISVVTGEGCQDLEHHANFWKTSVSVNEKEQKAFVVPDIDEPAMLRGLADVKKRTMNREFRSPSERLEKLQLLLLLIVQVVTVRELTMKPSDDIAMDLSTIVGYHARIGRAAERADIASSDGLARNTSKRRRDVSPWTSSSSDSDVSVRRAGPSRGPPPPPPPPGWMQNTSPPRGFGPPPPPLLPSVTYNREPIIQPQISINHSNTVGPRLSDTSCGPADITFLSSPSGAIQSREVESKLTKDPPVYTEKEEAAAIANAKEAPPSAATKIDSKTSVELAGQTTEQTQRSKPAPAGAQGAGWIGGSPARDNPHLLTCEISGLGTKIRTFFRTKSSLEAEMKRTLASANASLKAFLIQDKDFRMVPHSAFHSLEYTHMRAILSQLKDNAWFRTFSDLTDAEHEALAALLSKHLQDGKWVQRELVVLKVMQQNRFNAWMRIMEECLGLGYSIPQYENYRVTLAIVREKECAPDHKAIKPPKTDNSGKATECYQPPLVPHVPDPFLNMPPDGKLIVDLKDASRPIPAANSFTPSGGPLPYPPTNWAPSRHMIYSSHGVPIPSSNVEYYDVSPQHATSESSALEALTSYASFTIRPAPIQQSPLAPLLHLPPTTWARCSITREREVTVVLLRRIQEFHSRGDSIIDLKMELTEPQSAQLNRLVQEVNRQEHDYRFDHKIVELSMMDHERGIVRKRMSESSLDVIHLIVRRGPKDGMSALTTYNSLMRSPVRGPPPPPPPPPPVQKPIHIIDIDMKSPVRYSEPRRSTVGRSRNRRRSVSTYYSSDSSDSDSSTGSTSTISSVGFVYRNKKGQKMCRGRRIYDSSDESDADEDKPRWKVDPVLVLFGKKEKGSDVVQLLLDRWTPSKGNKVKENGEKIQAKEEGKKTQKEAKEEAKKKRKSRRARVVELYD